MYASMGSQCMRRWARSAEADLRRDPRPGLAEILERFEDTSRRHTAQLESFPAEQWARSKNVPKSLPIRLSQDRFHEVAPPRGRKGQGRRAACGCHGLNHPAEGRRATDPDWLS